MRSSAVLFPAQEETSACADDLTTLGKQSTSKPTTADWAALRMATRDAKMDGPFSSHIARHDAGFK